MKYQAADVLSRLRTDRANSTHSDEYLQVCNVKNTQKISDKRPYVYARMDCNDDIDMIAKILHDHLVEREETIVGARQPTGRQTTNEKYQQ